MQKTIAVLGALVTASALLVPTVSRAATVNSVRVSYADLNLATDRGQQVLGRRIAYAALTVCEIEDSRELALAAATKGCRSDAIETARPAFEAAIRSARRGNVFVLDGAALMVTAR